MTNNTTFCWTFDTTHSESSLRWHDGQRTSDRALCGVLVRSIGRLTNPEGWRAADLEYIQVETQAALFAWLHNLSCPVVNRFTADLWFRPQRPFLEWYGLFVRCGLPTLHAQVTNDLEAARHFAHRWNGELLYMPLTSSKHYPVNTAQQWEELARLMKYLPVALVEPYHGSSCYVTIVGQQMIWNADPMLSAGEHNRIDAGLRQLAHILQTDFVQVELLIGTNGVRCVNVHVFPLFAVHSIDDQLALGDGIVALLTGRSKIGMYS